ncbi:MAG TPA: 1,4-dihydroxy-2-naphthoate polyprenyltransferase [Kineosporiaceae bacterium]
MASRAQWIAGARPRTLPAALSPVLVGTGAALGLGSRHPGRALTALLVALALQVGVNYANDYSDGVRGTDDDRVGPFRLTASGAARPGHVRAAAFGCFAAAGLAGLGLVAASGTWWLIVVGAAAILAAWYYTGGSRPYGYHGLGEVFVFVFFGLVAVLGTTYTQALTVNSPAVAGAVGVGVLACAILVANNLRDVPTDAVAGKLTLAVRIGAPGTRRLYAGLVGTAMLAAVVAAVWRPWSLLALASAAAAVAPLRAVATGATGRDLLPVLRDTGRLELCYAVLLAIGLAA